MESCVEDSTSEEDENKQLEEELYSVFYYNDFSKGIPEKLASKYNISLNDDRVVVCLKDSNDEAEKISIKQNEEQQRESKVERVSVENDQRDVIVNTSKVINVKKSSKLKKGYDSPKSITSDEEVVIVEETTVISDSENSVVIIEDIPKKKARYDQTFLERSLRTPLQRPEARQIMNRRTIRSAPVLISSDSSDFYDDDSDSFHDIQLNASFPYRYYKGDRSVMTIRSDYKWKDTDSPLSWTNKMKKYYNKPCKSLINFNHHEMIKNMRRKGGDWFLSPLDLMYHHDRGNDLRCHKCNEFGHFSRTCDREINCQMCGEPGHMESHCPSKMCLNCGAKRRDNFMAGCHKCFHDFRARCPICKTKGHPDYLCPDVWRRFHSTTAGEPQCNDSSEDNSSNYYCCNCASRGHLYENCREARWSPYPIHSSFVNNYKGETGVKSEHSILLPDDLKPDNESVRNVLRVFKKKGLKLSVNTFKGINAISVKGKFGTVSKFRENLLSLSVPNLKKKKKKKKKKRNEYDSPELVESLTVQ